MSSGEWYIFTGAGITGAAGMAAVKRVYERMIIGQMRKAGFEIESRVGPGFVAFNFKDVSEEEFRLFSEGVSKGVITNSQVDEVGKALRKLPVVGGRLSKHVPKGNSEDALKLLGIKYGWTWRK